MNDIPILSNKQHFAIIGFILCSIVIAGIIIVLPKGDTAAEKQTHSNQDAEVVAKTIDPFDSLYGTIQNTFDQEFEAKYINARLTHQAITDAMLPFALNSTNAKIREYAAQVQADTQAEAAKLRAFAAEWSYMITQPNKKDVELTVLSLQKQAGAQLDRQFAIDMIAHLNGSTRMAQLAVTNSLNQEMKDLATTNINTAQARDEPFFRWATDQKYTNTADELTGHTRHDE